MSNFNIVTSRDNPLIKLVSLLQKSSKARKDNGLFVLEGLRICEDAVDNGIRFDKFIISDTAFYKLEDYIETLASNSDLCFKIPDNLFLKISDTASPQGILAVCKRGGISMPAVNPRGKYIALENIADPSNLGAVSRTAEALGVSGIILSSGGCDPYSPKALRSSMGTLLRVPVIITESFPEFIKESGLKSYACVVDRSAASITDIKFSEGCVVIIGNEANGLTEDTIKSADKAVTIRMSGRAESLNAAVAAAISAWEMMR